MFRIRKKNVIGILEQLAKELNADFSREFSCGSLHINNENAKGSITAYELFPGLAAMIYDIEFHKEIEMEIDESFMNPMYFIFCLDGNLDHRFSDEDSYRQISFQQNVILASSKVKHNVYKFPKNVNIESSFIYLLREVHDNTDKKPKYLRSGLDEILENIGEFEDYKFYGRVRPKTSVYLDRIIHNNKTGIVARLMIEASIYSILALQLEYHDMEKAMPTVGAPLKKDELKRILDLSEQIIEQLHSPISIEDLSKLSSLNPKKLQAGYRYLFGVSANNYIKNVRLEKALELLQTTDLSISEVVYKVGLSSRSYFTKIFFERYGYNPSDYKKLISTIKVD